MATVTRITKTDEKRTLSIDKDSKIKLSYEQDWVVEFDGPGNAGAASIAVANGKYIPQIGYQYPSQIVEPATFVQEVKTEKVSGDNTKWKVEVSYDQTEPPEQSSSGDPQEDPVPPFKLPEPEIDFGFESQRVPATKDIKDRPVANSAGMLFDPPLEVERYQRTITIVNYRDVSYQPAIEEKWIGAVNEATFMARDPGTLWLAGIKTTPQYDETTKTHYYKTEYELKYDTRGWRAEVVDHGPLELETALAESIVDYNEVDTSKIDYGAKRKQATDKHGQPMKDVLLDGHGKALGEGDEPVILPFTLRTPLDFNDLGIKLPTWFKL